jgi:DNA-binding transcriptional LysR family regulator
VQLLEGELGYALLNRTSRQVGLTPAGQALRAKVSPHVEALHAAVAEARDIHRLTSRRLRVGFVANLSYIFLPEILGALREREPDALIEVHESPTPRQLESLHADRIDVGIALAPIDDAEMMQRRLFSENFVVMLKSDHRFARRSGLHLEELVKEPFVVCPRYRKTGLHEVVVKRCAQAGFRPRIAQEVGGQALVEELVASGVGLAVMPESASYVPRSQVAFVPLLGEVEPIQVHAIWKKDCGAPLLRTFLDLAVAEARVWKRRRPKARTLLSAVPA